MESPTHDEPNAKRQKTDDQNQADPVVIYKFTDDQKQMLLDEAKSDGFWSWLGQYAPLFGLPSLFTVFDYELPPHLLTAEADELLPLLKAVFAQKVIINNKASKRTRIESLNTFDDAVDIISKSKNIIVLTGHGN